MKKLVSLLSALTMCVAVPMSASAVDYVIEGNNMIFENYDEFYARASADLSIYDFNADGVTDKNDATMILSVASADVVDFIEINMDKTYTILSDDIYSDITEDEIARVIANGNITNPNWESGTYFNGENDVLDPTDASFLLKMIYAQYNAGDVNTDNTVDALDASAVLTYYAKSQSGVTDYEYNASDEKMGTEYLGDYDGDGAINALDASEIMADYAAAQTE